VSYILGNTFFVKTTYNYRTEDGVRSFTSVSEDKSVGNFGNNLVQHFPHIKKIGCSKICQIWQIRQTKNIYANHLQKMPNFKNLA